MEFVYRSDQWVTCYHPLRGYYGKTVDPKTGRRPIVFNRSVAFSGVPLELPCGWCVGCKLERARQWALRIVHEKRLHRESAFLTLTYDDAHLPRWQSLVLRDLQLFMKRLRKLRGTGLRFFACGEYGETTFRPHYHVLLLNTSFHDCLLWKMSGEHPLYVSAELRRLWPSGDSYVGECTFASASYVSGYCTKKVLDKACLPGRAPEFICMSRNPGIGSAWFDKYKREAYDNDSAIADGHEVSLPRYYDEKWRKEVSDDVYERMKKARIVASRPYRSDNTKERLRVRERVDELRIEQFRRSGT